MGVVDTCSERPGELRSLAVAELTDKINNPVTHAALNAEVPLRSFLIFAPILSAGYAAASNAHGRQCFE